jgi:hypothetical protein
MGQRRHHRHIGAGLQRQVVIGLICGLRTMSIRRGSITISFAPSRRPLLHAAGEDRVPIGGIGADDQDDVGILDTVEILRAALVPNVWTGHSRWANGRRAHVSTLLLPKPAAHQLLDKEASSLVQRLDVMPPSARAPCAP